MFTFIKCICYNLCMGIANYQKYNLKHTPLGNLKNALAENFADAPKRVSKFRKKKK